MNETKSRFIRVPALKTVEDFRAHVKALGLQIPCDEEIETTNESPLAQPVSEPRVNGKKIGNRFAIQPMEGWDGTTTGGAGEDMLRRWSRFGESGAKLICGCEAMAVRADGRANPNQLIICEENKADLARLRDALVSKHCEVHGSAEDLVVGFQLTHSGRFCRPDDKRQMKPRVAYRHPILDKKFGVTSDAQVFTDSEIEELIQCYIRAAKVASDVGADFVDIKHCHGYLLHEFLTAHQRPGKYGGAFENRTRILREVVAGIRASGNPVDLAVRLSAFDSVPFRPDPASSEPGKLGPGIPEEFSAPYPFAFGAKADNPLETDLAEPIQFMNLCAELGIKILNISAGTPYYSPHLERPAAYPPSDGYQPAHDPLIEVARHIETVRRLKAVAPKGLIVAGAGYSYLQEFLPHVAQAVIRNKWADVVGIGRMALSYPTLFTDAIKRGELNKKFICRTFSDCTTAPRNGLVSGCYPLDKHYAAKPEFQKLKEIKKSAGA